jgi:outer membrane protein TolC
MRNYLYIEIILIAIFSIQNLKSQEKLAISKQEVLSKISQRNLTLKISEKDVEKAKAAYNQTQAVFLPNITASHTGITTTNPLMAFGSKLNQGILTAADFNPNLLNNPESTQNFATIIKIEQPLINLDGLYQRKAAKSKMEAMSLQTERTADYLELEVEKAYMQLQLAYKGVNVLENALKTSKAHKKIAMDNFKQGYLQRADVLNVDIRVTEVKNQLQTAKSNILNASNYLSFLMNDEGYKIYKPSDSLSVISFEINTKKVSRERADIKAMELSLKVYEALNKADKMAFLPRLNAFGTYEMYDNTMFQGNASGYVLGAQFSWNLFEGSKRIGKAQKSKADAAQSQLAYDQLISHSNLELNKAKRQLTDAKNRLELTQLAVQQSKESLRIRKNRFEEGLEKTADLLQSETQFAQKQLEYYQTIFEYNFTQSYIQFLTKE